MEDGTLSLPALDFVRPKSLRQLRRVRPVWDGQYTNLSGIYACINALRLVLEPFRPLPPADCAQLYRFAVRLLDRCDKLATAAERGIGRPEWAAFARAMADRAEDLACTRIAHQQPCTGELVGLEQLIEVIRFAIDARDVVLVALEGRYDHYTVIAGYSRTRLRLFDSYGYSWLNLIACDVVNDTATARHRIDAASLITLGLAPSQQTDLLKDAR